MTLNRQTQKKQAMVGQDRLPDVWEKKYKVEELERGGEEDTGSILGGGES